MIERTRSIQGVQVPAILYGTAWKEDRTAGLVTQALEAGFRGIDTAAQRKHYNEAGVGEALAEAFQKGTVRREDLFLQTKFSPVPAQDHRLPYDPKAPESEQVPQSMKSSLSNLGVDQLDSYVLHGPTQPRGLGEAERETWRAMEQLHDEGKTRLIGVSNFGPDQLEELCQMARIQPAFVQNRCFARLGWDAKMREVCDKHGVVYQGFSLLTANRDALSSPAVQDIAQRHGRTVPQVIFRFALAAGMIPLTGTTDPEHMKQDLAVFDFELTDDEVKTIEGAAV
jgi:diketogulonate reductase-like aldo/keto reductase